MIAGRFARRSGLVVGHGCWFGAFCVCLGTAAFCDRSSTRQDSGGGGDPLRTTSITIVPRGPGSGAAEAADDDDDILAQVRAARAWCGVAVVVVSYVVMLVSPALCFFRTCRGSSYRIACLRLPTCSCVLSWQAAASALDNGAGNGDDDSGDGGGSDTSDEPSSWRHGSSTYVGRSNHTRKAAEIEAPTTTSGRRVLSRDSIDRIEDEVRVWSLCGLCV